MDVDFIIIKASRLDNIFLNQIIFKIFICSLFEPSKDFYI